MVLNPRRHSKTRATCESAVISVVLLSIGSPNWCDDSSVAQEQLQQIIQEALTAQRGRYARVRARDQTELLSFFELAAHRHDRKARTLFEHASGEAARESQCVHHEFERQVGSSNDILLLHRLSSGSAFEILARMLP